jgi:hypothetical protein
MLDNDFLIINSDISEDVYCEESEDDVAGLIAEGPSARLEITALEEVFFNNFREWKSKFITFLSNEKTKVLQNI